MTLLYLVIIEAVTILINVIKVLRTFYNPHHICLYIYAYKSDHSILKQYFI